MRICSFVPGATEVVAALGMADSLVGISHECDYPPSVRQAPVLVRAALHPDTAASAAIDQQVKVLAASGQRLYRLDERAFVEANPDAILTQDLCHVCAVTPDQLARATRSLAAAPRMLTLNPSTLGDVIRDVERIGGVIDRSTESKHLADRLRQRLSAVQAKTAAMSVRPRVLCLEWLSPLYIGGHWVPDMVQAAGGVDVLGTVSSPSQETSWEELRGADPDVVILMPCGFSVNRAWRELQNLVLHDERWARALAAWPNTFIVDAASYFSRPGPRLIDGLELLAAIFSGNFRQGFGTDTVARVPASLSGNQLPS